jgi:FkbM family methyltransferase
MKKIIKSVFSHEIVLMIIDIKAHLSKLKRIYFNKSKFSSSRIDEKLKKYLNYRDGIYIELGANDGLFSSNTYHLQKQLNWKGILIEPALDLYFKCKRNRGNCNLVLNYACVPFSYKEKFVTMIYSGAMTTTDDLQNEIENPGNHAKSGGKFIPNYDKLIRFATEGKTLNKILIEANVKDEIDFLSLDVEGVEIEVLKGIDFKKYSFKYMLIESRDIEKLNLFLSQKNYKLVEQLTEIDYLFSKTNV